MSSLLRRSLSVAAATVMVGASMTFMASAASAAPTVTIDPSPVQQGQELFVGGTECWNPEDPSEIGGFVSLSIDGGEPLITEVAADGSWGGTLEITAEDAIGQHPVAITCTYYSGSFDYAVTGAIDVIAPITPYLVIVPKEILVEQMSNSGPGVAATATGFGQEVDVTIVVTLPDGTTQNLPAAVSDYSGKVEFTVFYTGPSAPLGRYTVTVTDTEGHAAAATFKVVTALTPSIQLKSPTTVQGGSNNVKALGFIPGESVEVWIFSDPVKVATVVADTDGAINTDFVVPASVSVGDHTVVVKGVTSQHAELAALKVTAKAAAGAGSNNTKGPSLAATGVDVPTIAGFGLVLLVAGAGALVIGRRRDEATSSI